MQQNQPPFNARPVQGVVPKKTADEKTDDRGAQDMTEAQNCDDTGFYSMVCGDFGRAVMLLSRIPWPADVQFRPTLIARSVWCWPLAGLFLAGLAVLPALALLWLSDNNGLAAVFAVLTMVVLTGALHEDGLADCADGFGGGITRDRKLEIMRDSRIGSYGVVALVLAFAARFFIAMQAFDLGIFITATIITAMFSRLAMPVLMMGLSPARSDGLGHGAGRPGVIPFLIALLSVLLVTIILGGAVMMLAGLLALVCACLVVGFVAKWQIGGHSGDVLGSAQMIAEIFVAIAILSVAVRGM